MFRLLRLSDSFQHLVTPEEWHWFGPMVARRVYHYDRDGWPAFPIAQIKSYAQLWRAAADQAFEKLRDGEWAAEGISAQYGPHPVPIGTDLWDYLRIKDRLEEAEGAGFNFVALTVSDLRLPKVEVSHAEQAHLRRQLTQWLQSHAAISKSPLLRSDQLAAAREAFAPAQITDNMYRECRRAADLPPLSVQRGRPKTKG